MDSLTQALLGAATFSVVKNRSIGKISILIGALAGTLPDLDVLLSPFFNEVTFLTVHRSFSHSILFAVLVSAILAAIFHLVYKKQFKLQRWFFAFFLSIFTHAILDCFTTYGTKLLCPFKAYMFSTNNIHTIEPVYTIILLIGVICFLMVKAKSLKAQRIIRNSLIISCLYLGWTFSSKAIAVNNFTLQLKQQNIAYTNLMVSPTPLNSLLWNVVAKTNNGYYFGNYSLLDGNKKIIFYYENSNNKILEDLKHNKIVQHYLDYTQNFPLVKLDENGLVKIYAIKFGPYNYFGKPEFVYPLEIDLNNFKTEHIAINYEGYKRGPVKNYKSLFKRVLSK